MAIQFRCPHCQKLLTVRDDFVGKTGTCNGCKGKLIVPQPVFQHGTTPPPTLSGPESQPPLAVQPNQNPFAFLDQQSRADPENPLAFLEKAGTASPIRNRAQSRKQVAPSDLPGVMTICGKVLIGYHVLSMLLIGGAWLISLMIAFDKLPQGARMDPGAVVGSLFVVFLAIGLHFVLYRIASGITLGQKAAVYGLALFTFLILGGTVVLLTSESAPLFGIVTTRQIGIVNAMYVLFLCLPALIAAFTSWRKLT